MADTFVKDLPINLSPSLDDYTINDLQDGTVTQKTPWSSVKTLLDSLPIVHYVYLVQDASDQARMGGTASNVYITAQDAYDAALALRAVSGGIVVIRVGVTTAAVVGGISLSANMLTNPTQSLRFEGISSDQSAIGDITSNGFTVTIRAVNMAFGNIITTSNSGANSGFASIVSNNCTFTSIDTSAATTGNAGNITYNGNNISTSNITASGGTTGNGGSISIGATNSSIAGTVTSNGGNTGDTNGGNITFNNQTPTGTLIGSITTTGNDNGSCGTVTLRNVRLSATITMQDGALGGGNVGTLSLTDCEIGSAIIIKYGGSSPSINIIRSVVTTLDVTNNSAVNFADFVFTNSTLNSYIFTPTGGGLYGDWYLDKNTEFKPGSIIAPYSFDITGSTTIAVKNMNPESVIFGSTFLSSTNAAESVDTVLNLPQNKVVRFYSQPGLDVTIVNGAGANNPHTKTGANVVLTGADYDWIELMLDSNTGNVIEVNSSLS